MRKVVTGPMRLPFLILTPACVLVGIASAAWSGTPINPSYVILILIGAISTHISVNALNEHSDFKSGLDLVTQPTPFSGGSKALPASPEKSYVALITGFVAMAIAAIIGIYFLFVRGFWLLPLGLLGLAIIYAYTPWITKRPVLCLIAPGLGFGPLMVMGTDFVLSGRYSWTAFIASLVPFFLVNDLLLLNQFPDVEADKSIGRRHLPITIGRKASAKVYGVFLLSAYLPIVIGYLFGELPRGGFIGFATLILAIPTIVGVLKFADDRQKLIPFMGKNVLINIATPVLLSIGLFLGRWVG
jgi:1,4-dihydroxy-2-naphthoate octaprenyltransferase